MWVSEEWGLRKLMKVSLGRKSQISCHDGGLPAFSQWALLPRGNIFMSKWWHWLAVSQRLGLASNFSRRIWVLVNIDFITVHIIAWTHRTTAASSLELIPISQFHIVTVSLISIFLCEKLLNCTVKYVTSLSYLCAMDIENPTPRYGLAVCICSLPLFVIILKHCDSVTRKFYFQLLLTLRFHFSSDCLSGTHDYSVLLSPHPSRKKLRREMRLVVKKFASVDCTSRTCSSESSYISERYAVLSKFTHMLDSISQVLRLYPF